jgi:hypothetical protein
MAIPVLRSLSSTELEPNALPPNPESCSVYVHAAIGPRDAEGADNFSFSVVTPDQILEDSGGMTWGRGYLIVDRFSWEAVDRAVSKLLLHADRDSWAESAQALAKELHSEFENYTEISPG